MNGLIIETIEPKNTASLAKPVSLAKHVRPAVDQSSLVAVKLPPKVDLTASAEHTLSVFEEGHDALVVALARTDDKAVRSIQASMVLMRLTAMNYELQSGRRFNPEPIFDFSFDSPIVNRGGWMRIGNQVVRAAEHFVNPDSPLSLAKKPTSYARSPTEALVLFFGAMAELHCLLRSTDRAAVVDIQVAMIEVLHAARDYEILSGNTLTPKAAITAAFGNPAINRGGWVRLENGGLMQSYAKRSFNAFRNALRAA